MIITAADFFSRAPAELPPDAEDAFFSAIRNRNSTFKRTYRARFQSLDEAVVRAFASRSMRPEQILDVGVSSGATTLDLRTALLGAGYDPRITATDLSLHAELVSLGKGVTALVSPDRHVLQIALAGWSVRPWRRRLDWITGMWAIRPLLLSWAERQVENATRRRPVMLVSPRLRDYPAIRVVEDDVLKRRPEFEAKFQFVRAANILNHDYFDEDQLRAAVRNLRAYLAGPGSLLLIVRSLHNGEQHGSLFELGDDGRLSVCQRFGSGSEIEQLALAS